MNKKELKEVIKAILVENELTKNQSFTVNSLFGTSPLKTKCYTMYKDFVLELIKGKDFTFVSFMNEGKIKICENQAESLYYKFNEFYPLFKVIPNFPTDILYKIGECNIDLSYEFAVPGGFVADILCLEIPVWKFEKTISTLGIKYAPPISKYRQDDGEFILGQIKLVYGIK